ncbi:hypothetical protein SAMN04488498_13412 [Mesorhizobium albiziae]|uniref:Uncharacterized protein n=1 Tax=Neomesorhizobium albiziae TaxID=335020 RepID=A0A1I4F095_9HYPH|nr:hypothetical protein [Mesorhizobium albiziae]SFL11422.1 hypothetical protein SAMN04488498_13412 [Mesorhizobium albiziae]
MADFQSNFESLKSAGVIPDVHEDTLPQNVRDVIGGLTPEEIKVLQKLADSTGSHLSLQNKQFAFSVCGL